MTIKKLNVFIGKIFNTDLVFNGLEHEYITELMTELKKLPSTLFKYTHQIKLYYPQESFDKDFHSKESYGLISINLNEINDSKELFKTILHELTHSLEEELFKNENSSLHSLYKETITEYLAKKRRLLINLRDDKGILEKPRSKYWKVIDFNDEFDNYLYNVITYPVLYFKISNLFPSPYAITSISEYICIGIEIFLLENKEWLKQYCPILYNLIDNLLNFKG